MARDPEVNVKIKGDDSGLKKLERARKQAFDPKEVREFTRAGKDLERQIGDLLKRQLKLTDEISKVERGTKKWKEFKDELKAVNEQATGLERTLGRVNRTVAQARRDEQRAADISRQRRQGFIGGFGQGAGVAQYLPTGAEQAPRMAGAMLGGGLRRTVGSVTAPFLMPGVGGLAQGAAGIPIIGGFIGGAMQAGAGMYQQAVGFQRQARGALFAQGRRLTPEEMQRRVAYGEAEVARVRRSGEMRAEAAMELRRDLSTENIRRAGKIQAGRIKATEAAGAGGMAMGGFSVGGMVAAEAKAARVPVEAEGIAQPYEVGTQTAGGRRRVRSMTRPASFRARLKGATADVEAVRRDTRMQIEAIRARARSQPTGLPGAGAGVEFGLGPSEMMAGFTQFMQARGGTYDQVRQSQFKNQMAAQVAFGVSAQQAGQLSRMNMPGGGGTAGGIGLAQVLQTAVAQGLKGSQVTEYLQTLVQLGQQAEKMGVKINAQEFTRGAATLTGAGLEGLQAQRVAGGLQQAAMNVSQRGVQSPVDVLLARAAGFNPEEGAEGYAKAMNKMSGGMTSGMMNRLLGDLTKGAGAGGFGPEMQALMLRRAMGKMGVQIGPDQATKLLGAYREGQTPDITKYLEGGERAGAGGWLRGRAREAVGRGAGLTVGAAGLEAYQVGVGERAAKWVVPLERASAKAANAISRLPLDTFAKSVERATTALDKMLSPGADVGLVEGLQMLFNAIRGNKRGVPGT